jgi:hypothetical protein
MARESNSRTAELWRSRIRAWRVSGLSVAAYCRHIGVSEPSFYQWRRKLEGAAGPAEKSDDGRVRLSSPEFSFLPVQVVGLGNAPLEIVLPNGVVVRVPPGCDRALLREVVRLWEDEAC